MTRGGKVAFMMMQITEILIQRLSEEGFKIQRYDSYGTNSIYLKLDYGVCNSNSIRISDHKGKKHLNYRSNLISKNKGIGRQKTPEGLDRYYYGFNQLDILIQDILDARSERVLTYGKERYEVFMMKNKFEGKNQLGFWSQCREVN